MGKASDNFATDRFEINREQKKKGSQAARSRERSVGDEPVDKHLDRLSYLLDKAIRIPGTNIRFGLDPIISFFFPVAGDLMGALISAYIVLVSVRYGLPKIVIARMVFNVALDFAIGSIPIIGDAFDFAWKSNDKNMRLLNRYASAEGRSYWSDWAWLFVLLGILVLLMIGLVALVYYALKSAGFRLI